MIMQTIVELNEYLKRSDKLLNNAVFGKGAKANLSKSERNQLASLVLLLRNNYGALDE